MESSEESSRTEAAAQARVVLVTAPDHAVARALAHGIVGGRLAACVNLIEGVTSIYRWQGAVEEQREVLLVIKTSAERVAALADHIDRHHPYDVPELIALEPTTVAPAYLGWLLESSGPGS